MDRADLRTRLRVRVLAAAVLLLAPACRHAPARLEWPSDTLGAPTCRLQTFAPMNHRLLVALDIARSVQATVSVLHKNIHLGQASWQLSAGKHPEQPVVLEGRVASGDVLTVSLTVAGDELDRHVCRAP